MKTMSVDEAKLNLPQALDWVMNQGEQVDLLIGNLCVARLIPGDSPQPQAATKWPDFAGRLQSIYGNLVLPGSIVLEERESYDR